MKTRATRQLNPFGIVLIGSARAMVYITLAVTMSWWLMVGLYVLAGLCGLLGILTLLGSALSLTYHGKRVSISCDDDFVMVDAVAKVVSLK